MRKKIEKLNNEVFRYHTPDIIVSEDRIEASIRPNKLFASSIEIMTSDMTEISGMVYSDNDLLSIKNNKFDGIRNEIQFELIVDSNVGSNHIEGNLNIISDCGEKKIPYLFEITKEGFDTPIGEVKDLFQFTDLAMEYPAKALEIFCSKSFKRIFLNGNKFEMIYDGIIKSDDAYASMEEFLVEINKKKEVRLSIEEKERVYYVDREDVVDEVTIRKSTWGYCKYKVYSDSNLIQLDKENIVSDDFDNNEVKVKYKILNVARIRNNADIHIYIENVFEKLIINVKCINKERNLVYNKEDDKRVLYKAFEKNYLNLKVGIIDTDRYIADNELVSKNLEEYGKSYMNELYKIHLLMVQKNTDKALKAVKNLESKLNIDYMAQPIIRCVCMYYKCIIKNDNRKQLRTTVDAIRSYYDNECHTWEFLSLLLRLDNRYVDKPERKIEAMREMSVRGCISPVMYYEAASIFKENLDFLEKIGKFEIQVINWTIKNYYMDEELSKAYAVNISRIREYNSLVYRNLVKLYEMYSQKEVVNSICTMLIKGQIYGKKYSEWYKRAIEYNLRITGLFEGYLYSCDDNDEMLPDVVFSYFLGNDGLSDKRKGMLYANLIKYKLQNKNMYDAYLEKMKEYVKKQISMGNINTYLKVVYEEILPLLDSKEIAKDLLNVLFAQEVECHNSSYKGVLVKHKVMDEEQYVPFVSDKAIINVFSDSVAIFLVDLQGARHMAKGEYKIDTLLNVDKYVDECFKYCKNNDMLAVFLSDKIDAFIRTNDEEKSVKRHIVTIENINNKYKNRCLYELVVYAYENMQIELLDEYLDKIDMDYLEIKEKIYVMECYIIRGMWQNAISAIKENGYNKLPINKLLRLVQKILDSEDMEEKVSEKEILVEICVYIFKKGKYNKSTLSYMEGHYIKDLEVMYDIWKVMQKEELDTKGIEESILTYMLYSDAYLADAYSVFESYYKKEHDRVLVGAYLKYCAYRYVVKGRILNEKIFDIFKIEEQFEKCDLYKMAILKNMSEADEISQFDKMMIVSDVEYFLKKDIVLSFFRKFNLECMKDKYVVEYVTDPKVRVSVLYNMGDEDDNFYNEEMKDVFFGIRSKEFILFYGDNLQYYIVEDNKGDNKITESLNLNVMNGEQDDESRYGKINLMLMTKEMKDEETLIDTMKGLAITDYITDSIFMPL